MRIHHFARSFAFAIVLLVAPRLSAQAPLITGLGGDVDLGENVLPANDDGSTALIDLTAAFPAGLRFYGRVYPGLYVNNNGNVSFGAALGTYTPNAFPLPATDPPIISPWWGDIDTRNRSGVGFANLVYWDVTPGRLVVTWYDTGRYNSINTLRVSAQMIITDASAFGIAGAFDVEFRYNRCEWVVGGASGDTSGNGFCEALELTCVPAQAGFDAGDGVNFVTLPGSRTNAVQNLCTTSNVGTTGVWRFQVRPSGVTVCGNSVREMGEECDDGNVANGDGCNQRCSTELTPGSPCGDDLACRTGICVDGVCCNARCDGQCEACDVAGSAGTCSAVSGAPHGTRGGCPGFGATCGGRCDGTTRTACTFPGSSTTCDDGSSCSVSDVCNGGGTCAGVGLTCDDGFSCTADSCAAGLCLNSLMANFCVIDGACVPSGTEDPTNPCRVCNPALSIDSYAPRAAGFTCSDRSACTGPDVCDGAGGCVGPVIGCADDGIACTTAMCEPLTGECTSPVTTGCLIAGACIAAGTLDPTNPCRACDPLKSTTEYTNLEAGIRCAEPMCDGSTLTLARSCDGGGVCAPADTLECESGCMDAVTCRGGCTIDDECPSDRHCEEGVCREDLPDGGDCGRAEACESGLCIDGVCCGTSCEGLCEACNLPGSEGTCSPHGSGTDPDDECVEVLSCDGNGMCEVPVTPDAGMPDSGVMVDAGVEVMDAGSDAGGRRRSGPGLSGGACSCRAAGTGTGGGASVLALLGLALVLARRRR